MPYDHNTYHEEDLYDTFRDVSPKKKSVSLDEICSFLDDAALHTRGVHVSNITFECDREAINGLA